MNKALILKLSNLLLLLLFIVQAGSGLGREFLDYKVFEKIHSRTGFLLIIMVVLHLWLNRNWIKSNFFKRQ